MSVTCIGEPVSWLRLELYHSGELAGTDRTRVVDHLAMCPACAICLAKIREDAAWDLPPLPAPRAGLGRRSWGFPLAGKASAAIGALAAAAAVVLAVRGAARPERTDPREVAQRSAGGVKGGAVAFSLVREDGERIDGPVGSYRDGDRFKALVTCAPGAEADFDVAVFDETGVSFPLEAARSLACGNGVALPGAFRLTGHAGEEVCLSWSGSGPVDRRAIARRAVAEDRRLCKLLAGTP